IAIQTAATSAITAARCALTLPDAISTNNTTTGIAATSVDNHSLPRGLYTWFHMVLLLPRGVLLQGKITGCGWTVTMAGPILGRYFYYAHSARNLPPRPDPRGHRPGQCHPAGVRGVRCRGRQGEPHALSQDHRCDRRRIGRHRQGCAA